MSHPSCECQVAERNEGFQINPPIDPVRVELERALAPAGSGRAALAKVTALRTLEKLARPVDDGSYPVDDDGPLLRRAVGGVAPLSLRLGRDARAVAPRMAARLRKNGTGGQVTSPR